MTYLEPCPYCGGAGMVHQYPDVFVDSPRDAYNVECGACRAMTRNCQTQDEAEEMWNRQYVSRLKRLRGDK